ncbi:MAG: hypothetical protein RBG13Loki_1597 [Promethearchaeota archaeon CR_4]|nr:MAG: hypothetical protein RBG13Loki_1597 [Candidatus Lokiarchaeota archaeon CR_4]
MENLGIAKVDLVALTDYLCQPAYRVRTLFFDGKVQENLSFHDSLRLMDRFEVTLGDVVPREFYCPHCKEHFTVDTQKRVDVALAVEMVHLATSKHVDSIVLVAGDRDFLPAITAVKHEGVIIRLVHGPVSTVSELLYQTVDERVELTQNYLQNAHISFESITEQPPTVPEKTKTKTRPAKPKSSLKETKPAADELPEVKELLQRITADNLAKTSKREMRLASVGEELKKVAPTWRKKYSVKTINDLLLLAGPQFRREKIGKSEYVVPLETGEPAHALGQTTPLRQFLLDALAEYFAMNPDKKHIITPQLGTLLSQKDKNWKKTYKTKHLTDALEVVKDTVTVAGKGPKQTIRLK